MHFAFVVRHCDKTGILVGGAIGPFFEGLAVLSSPPVLQISLGIVLATLVVEAVGHSWPITAPMPP